MIEVNHLPSFRVDSEVDKKIKEPLILDTLKLLNITRLNKAKKIIEMKRQAKSRQQGLPNKILKEEAVVLNFILFREDKLKDLN